MASQSNKNFFGYRVQNNISGQTPKNVSVAFCYKGYEIAFSTANPQGDRIKVLHDGVLIGDYGSVEAACARVDEISAGSRSHVGGWQTGAHAAPRGPYPGGRARH